MKQTYKRLFYIACLALAIVGGLQFGKSDFFKNRHLTIMGVKQNIYDFGTIPQGKEVKTFFKYTNIGNAPLVLEDVQSRCGCTVANWDKERLEENNTDSLAVYYDAKGLGYFSKEVLVYYNSQKGPKQLFVTGTVVKNITE